MPTMITEVYEALKEANVSDAKAIAAATSIPTKENLATREDLWNLETRLNGQIVGLEKDIQELENNVTAKILRLENKILLSMGAMFVVAVAILGTLMKFFQSGATP